MCDTSDVLVRPLIIWDHTVLPASRLYPDGTIRKIDVGFL